MASSERDVPMSFRSRLALWRECLAYVTDEWGERLENWKQNRNTRSADEVFEPSTTYEHLYRKKTRWELTRISAAVMGIEFCYAAETAFVSPRLLEIGLPRRMMTLIWCLSPLIGFFLTPVLGSLSDGCYSVWGRRRPFILILSVGMILGLILVPHGTDFGVALGDKPTEKPTMGILLTVLGTVLLDFDADACQSPARAYMLDTTIPVDHARGLSMFTIMAGLGGCVGYFLGGLDWTSLLLGEWFGSQEKAVFSLVLVIHVCCIAATVTSFKEIPLEELRNLSNVPELEPQRIEGPDSYEPILEEGVLQKQQSTESPGDELPQPFPTASSTNPFRSEASGLPTLYGTTSTQKEKNEAFQQQRSLSISMRETTSRATVSEYLHSILHMPGPLRMLCLTNLFCWMSLVCYSLYFTDFVGEAVFGGDPTAEKGTELRETFGEGVRFGCFGMSLYSLSCSLYSCFIEILVNRFGAKRVYTYSQLIYTFGMICMALLRTKASVIIFSCCAGVMYSILFTMPYILAAHYHTINYFAGVRGIGTDVAAISSMCFLAQFLLSSTIGTLTSWAGTTTTTIVAAAVLSFCGAISAQFVTYAGL